MNKQLIKKRFTKSLDTYEQQADVQQEIAEKLAAKATEYLPRACNSLLEIGCGTGFLTRKLLSRFSINRLFLNDLVEELSARFVPANTSSEICFLPGDAEKIAFPEGLQGILSASTFQWMVDLPALFAKVNQALLPDGVFLFNTFGPENFREIKTLIKSGLHYSTIPEIKDMLSPHFEIIEAWEESHTRLFDTPRGVLRHLQETGVTATSGNFCWSKKELKTFEDSYYQLFSLNKKVTLSWQVYYFVCKKSSLK